MTDPRTKLSFQFKSTKNKNGFDDVYFALDDRLIEKRYFDHVSLVAVAGLELACIDVLTCDCGSAGCAGYYDPLIIETGEDTVTWHCPDDCADHLGVEKAVFDKAEYLAAIEGLQAEVVRRFSEGRSFMLLMDYDFDEDNREIDVRLDPAETVKAAREHFASKDVQAFAAEMKGHYVDGVPWPDCEEPSL